MRRVALGIVKGPGDAGARGDPSGRTAPRDNVFDSAFSPSWDESILAGAAAAGSGSLAWRLASELRRRHEEYDGIVTWGEKLSIAMMAQYQFSRVRKPHIALMYQFEKANIRVPMSVLGRQLHAVITWSSVQRRALIERLRFPAERVFLIRHYVDQVFYSPQPAEEDMICAVGAEMRDYMTLRHAIHGTGIRCHIAADHVRIPGRYRLLADRRVPIGDIGGPEADHLTVGALPLQQLREMYARSRFVVIPLLPSDTDNGVTCILQAMAMGKPVICSRTRGQVDVIREGQTGLYVPVGDAAALRAAILSLWHDPARAREMGRAARAHVEKYHALEYFTSTARSAAEASVEGRPAPDTWWV